MQASLHQHRVAKLSALDHRAEMNEDVITAARDSGDERSS